MRVGFLAIGIVSEVRQRNRRHTRSAASRSINAMRSVGAVDEITARAPAEASGRLRKTGKGRERQRSRPGRRHRGLSTSAAGGSGDPARGADKAFETGGSPPPVERSRVIHTMRCALVRRGPAFGGARAGASRLHAVDHQRALRAVRASSRLPFETRSGGRAESARGSWTFRTWPPGIGVSVASV